MRQHFNIDVSTIHTFVSVKNKNARTCTKLSSPSSLFFLHSIFEYFLLHSSSWCWMQSSGPSSTPWRNVAETGLNILYQMLHNVAQESEAAQSFYQDVTIQTSCSIYFLWWQTVHILLVGDHSFSHWNQSTAAVLQSCSSFGDMDNDHVKVDNCVLSFMDLCCALQVC